MSTTIDQRVVEMRFDNKQFESATKTTMSTLDKLKQSLNLTGASKGLEDVNRAASKVNFSGITSGIETVQAKFSYMQATIQHQINRIVDSTIAAGKRMASALTIDPIKSGFTEYETQINAVQTILANTSHAGTNLQDVNRVLDDLNLYADKTIYNFTQMTKNIGTFTAAGLGLEESAAAIKGIANLAAVSGSTSQQASTAMYQLSQALANGRVNLQDWNSVVNAGMGGKVFQDALVRTAAAMKGVSEETFRAQNITGSFRESISSRDGSSWLSAEVLSKTLQQFTGDMSDAELAAMGFTEAQIVNIQKMAVTANEAATKVKTFTQLWDTLKEAAQSGWTQSWEIMIGDFEEAKEELTKISDTVGGMLGESAERRNTMLSEGLSSGWKQLLNQGIVDEIGYKESIEAIAKEHGVAFDDIIRKTEEAGGSFEDALITSLKDGKINSDILSESVTHLADKMRNMSEEEKKAAGYTDAQIESIEKLEKGLKDGSISMDEFVTKMTRLSGRQNIIQALWNSFNALLEIVKPIKEAFREVFPPMTGEQLYAFTEGLRKLTENFKISDTTAKNIKSTFKGLFSLLDIGVEFIKALAGGSVDLIKNFAGIENGILGVTASIGDYISNFRDSVKETDLFRVAVEKVTGFISLAIDKLKEFGKSVKIEFETPGYEGFVGFLKFIWDIIKKIGSGITEVCSSITNGIANVFGESTFSDVLNSGLFAGILAAIFKFSNGLSKPLDGIADIFESITGKDGVLDNVKGILDDVRGCFQAYQDQLKAGTLLKIASAIGILAASIFVISTIDGGALEKSLGTITVLFAELLGSLSIFTKISGDITGTAKACVAMISMSIAIGLLAGALKKISSIDTAGIVKGLIAVGVLMGELSIFLRTAKIDGKITGTAIGIVILSSAMLILTKAVKNFGSMNWGEIGKGLVAIGALLTELAIFTKLTGNAKHVISTGIAIIALGAAMKIFASVVKDFSGMSWEDISKGLVAMGIALAELTIATKMMPKNMISIGIGLIAVAAAMKVMASTLSDFGGMSWTDIAKGLVAMGGALAELSIALNLMNGTLAGSAALIIAAGALAIIAPVMKTLAGLTWTEIAKGLVTLAGAFAVIGIAGVLLTPVIPAILGLAAAFALFGVATLGIGAGLTLIGVGLTVIATGFTALATAGAAGATAMVAALTVIVTGVLDLIPLVASKLGEAIIVFCKVIGECAPQIADTLLKVITEVLSSIATYSPQIVDALLVFLIGILDSIADNMPKLIAVAVRVIGSFFQGVVDALGNIDTTSLFKGIVGIGLLSGLMIALSAVAGLIPGAMIGVLGMGVVITELSLVLAAIGAIAQIPGLEWLISEGGDFLQIVGTAIGQFIGGIAGGIASGFSSSLPQIGVDLSSFMINIQPFLVGAKSIDESMMTGVKNLVATILLITAAEIIDSMASFITGGSSMAEFANQLVPFGEALCNFSSTVSGNIDEGAVTAAANAGKIMAEMASTLPNSGGVVGWFMGENDMSAFGGELVAFGTALSEFSHIVSGNVDEGAVVAAANAGKMMADMANTLPNSGGVVSWFTGDNDMSTFGKELVAFGKAIKEFSSTVSGNIDEEAVTAAANAGKMMADMANTLPNSGGVVSWFTGDNDMSTFGKELVAFGEAINEFSSTVSGNIDEEAVTAAASAGKILAEMAAVLPESGGIVSWFTADNDMSTFASELVPFGEAIKEFSKAVTGGIDETSVQAAANAGKILAEMATTLPDSGGLASLFSADNDISTFASELVPFGEAIKEFSTIVSGNIDEGAVTAATNAGKMLAEMATTLPDSGGISSWFTADNDMSTFGTELVAFGSAIKDFSSMVSGNIDEEAVTAAVNAGKTIAEMAAVLPESGGIMSWFTADNDMSTFGSELVAFGEAIKSFADSISGGINEEAVTAAANAGKIMASMVPTLPTSGGVVSWFTGEQNMAAFGEQLVPFGEAIVKFSDTLSGGINEESVTSASNAGKILAAMASTLPTSGGVLSWFTGEQNMATFGEQLVPFGEAMKNFSDTVSGGISEEAVTAAANSGKIMAEMANNLPESGGILSWFSADNDMSTFGSQLVPFGQAIKNFSDIVSGGVNEESVTAAANAGKIMAEMANNLPESGGILSWFSADNDMVTFGNQLVPFGQAIKNFSDTVSGGIDEESVTAAANAGKIMAEMATTLPDSGGLASWFSADNDMTTFANELVPFGKAIKQYSDEVTGINGDAISASATAAKTLSELANNLPDSGGIASWFTADNDMSTFGNELSSFGKAIKNYSDSVIGVDSEVVSTSITAAKSIIGFVQTITDLDTSVVEGFNVTTLGKSIKSYSDAVLDVDTTAVATSVTAANRIVTLINSMATLDTSGVGSFTGAVSSLSSTNFSGFTNAFKDTTKFVEVGSSIVEAIKNGITSKQEALLSAGYTLIDNLVKGINARCTLVMMVIIQLTTVMLTQINSKREAFNVAGATLITMMITGILRQSSAVRLAVASCVSSAVSIISGYYGSFYSAGSYLVSGFANGISENSYKAVAKAEAMAKAAAKAAEKALDINSPSKVGEAIGEFFGLGFANGIGNMVSKAQTAGADIADSAKIGLSNAISKVKDIIDSDIDAQPTIRPVLDLSEVQSGASAISGLFGNGASVGVMTNVGTIGSMMNNRQNGVNNDVVSAIDKLRNDMSNMGNTYYTIDGITYSEGTEVADAIKTLTRAVRVERRI